MIDDTNNDKTHTVDNICVTQDQFINFFLDRNYNENMFNNDGSINFNYNSQKKHVLFLKLLKYF